MEGSETSFIAQPNPVTGKLEWTVRECTDEGDDDFARDLLASSYGDMLHDVDRNEKYNAAIVRAVKHHVEKHGSTPHVLDIGTGTGILAMMAARAGAAPVTACEVFSPMINICSNVVNLNGFQDRITLLNKRSTDIDVMNDLNGRKADIIVSEILDTEFIGEGVISTIQHAIAHLATSDAVIIPATGVVWGMVVESPLLESWHSLSHTVIHTAEADSREMSTSPVRVLRATDAATGPYSLAPCGRMVDVQANMLTSGHKTQGTGHLCALSEPTALFSFDFTPAAQVDARRQLRGEERRGIAVPVTHTGAASALLLWWDAHLWVDPESQGTISTRPPLAEEKIRDSAPFVWRDHWMQSVYLLPHAVSVAAGTTAGLGAWHDEFSMWFALRDSTDGLEALVVSPTSTQLHLPQEPYNMWNRNRIWAMNDDTRRRQYQRHMEAVADGFGADTANVLVLGDTGYLALMLGAVLRARGTLSTHVYVLESSPMAWKFLTRLVHQHKLSGIVHVLRKSVDELSLSDFEGSRPLSGILAEPYYYMALLPWHSLVFWYARGDLAALLDTGAMLSPSHAVLKVMLVECEHLHRKEKPVRTAGGFNLAPYDDATIAYRGEVFPCALWEYSHTALSAPATICTLDLRMAPCDFTAHTLIPITTTGQCHALVCWIDFGLNDSMDLIVKGLHESDSQQPSYHRPGIQLLQHPRHLVSHKASVSLHTRFSADNCDFEFIVDKAHSE
eukprot:m.102909 g.102909  ORF g.102909 m.102909 type:complete len:731 (+) comp16829_c0_seq19:419-2611(+)